MQTDFLITILKISQNHFSIIVPLNINFYQIIDIIIIITHADCNSFIKVLIITAKYNSISKSINCDDIVYTFINFRPII